MTESSMIPQEACAAKIKQSLEILVTEWKRANQEYFQQLDVIRTTTTIVPTLDSEERPAALAHLEAVEQQTRDCLHLYIITTVTRPGEEMRDEVLESMQYYCAALPTYDAPEA